MVKGPVMSGSTEDENPYMYVDPKKYEGEDDNYLTTMVGKNTMEMYDNHADKGYLEPVRGKQTMETYHPPLTSNEYFEIVNGKTTASDPSTQDGYLEIVRGKTTVPDPPPRNEYKGQKCGNKTIQTSLPQTGGAKPVKNQMTKVNSVNLIGIKKTVLLVVLAIVITAAITAAICITIIDDSCDCNSRRNDSIPECQPSPCSETDDNVRRNDTIPECPCSETDDNLRRNDSISECPPSSCSETEENGSIPECHANPCPEDVCLNSDFSCQCQCTSSSTGQMCQSDNLVALCAEGFVQVGLSCYWISGEKLDRDAAKQSCKYKMAHLWIIDNSQEMHDLFDSPEARDYGLEDRRGYQIDLTDIDKEGVWVWESTGQQLGEWDAWNPGEPSNSFGGTEDCAHVTDIQSRVWNDERCTNQYHYICEVEI